MGLSLIRSVPLGIYICLLVGSFCFHCAQNQNKAGQNQDSKIVLDGSLRKRPNLSLTPIKDSVWMHRSYGVVQGSYMESNGLVVRTPKGAVLVDTAWTLDQTEELVQMIQEKFGIGVSLVILTHFHEDRRGGMEYFLKSNIPVQSSGLTATLLKKQGITSLPKADLNFNNRLALGGTGIEIYYPGEGHSPDNIVVWLPDTRILFGGCLIKSIDSKTMGNLSDANLDIWPGSLKKLLDRYPDMEVVVPGHGDWGKRELILHSLRLLSDRKF